VNIETSIRDLIKRNEGAFSDILGDPRVEILPDKSGVELYEADRGVARFMVHHHPEAVEFSIDWGQRVLTAHVG
jgi:hypothetical protein